MIDPVGLPDSGLEMSNFDGRIDTGLEEALRAGKSGTHAAWNFCGLLWFDPAYGGTFWERVSRYHSPVATVSAASLQELMTAVNDVHGWE